MKSLLLAFCVTITFMSCAEKNDVDYGKEMSKWRYLDVSELNRKAYSHKYAYNIISYVDSVGCISCKLQLERWQNLSRNIDSIYNCHIPILFLTHPKVANEMQSLILDDYNVDILTDSDNVYRQKYNLSDELMLQTFLVHNDTIIAIGNPVHNYRVTELFIKRLSHGK